MRELRKKGQDTPTSSSVKQKCSSSTSSSVKHKCSSCKKIALLLNPGLSVMVANYVII